MPAELPLGAKPRHEIADEGGIHGLWSWAEGNVTGILEALPREALATVMLDAIHLEHCHRRRGWIVLRERRGGILHHFSDSAAENGALRCLPFHSPMKERCGH